MRHADPVPLLPETIPSVNAVEFAAAMTASWERQTNRVITALAWLTMLAVLIISGINWGVQYRLSRGTLLLESTRANVVQSQVMIQSMREDRHTDEARFRVLMAAVSSIGQQAEVRRKAKGR